VFTGLGIVLCTGLVGCMNSDKDKLPSKIGANTKPAPPGLPGLNRIPGQPGSGGVGVNNLGGQPTGGGFQPAGNFGAGAGRQPTFNTTGTGFGSGSNVVPSMNPGHQPLSTTGSGFGGGAPQHNFTGADTIGGHAATSDPSYRSIPPAPSLVDPGLAPPARPDAPAGEGYPVAPPKPTIQVGGN
jgi:hypothetical protein